jgi:hypothetical protein
LNVTLKRRARLAYPKEKWFYSGQLRWLELIAQLLTLARDPRILQAVYSINHILLNFIYECSFLIFIIHLPAQIIDTYIQNRRMVKNI